MGIQMKHNELIKTTMMISNGKKTLVLQGFHKLIQRSKGWSRTSACLGHGRRVIGGSGYGTQGGA